MLFSPVLPKSYFMVFLTLNLILYIVKHGYFKLTTYLIPRSLETFLFGVLHTKGW